MADIKQLLSVLIQQAYTIKEVVVSLEMSHSLNPTTVYKIFTSHQPTPNIIENDNPYITPLHRVMPRQSNLQPHIINPEYLHPRMMDKQQHV